MHSPNSNLSDYPLRTTSSMITAADKAERDGVVIKGIKGKTALASMVDLSKGAPIEYMHCVLEDVVTDKCLLDIWVSSAHQPYYLNRHKMMKTFRLHHMNLPELLVPFQSTETTGKQASTDLGFRSFHCLFFLTRYRCTSTLYPPLCTPCLCHAYSLTANTHSY